MTTPATTHADFAAARRNREAEGVQPQPRIIVWIPICAACGKERPRETAETPKDLRNGKRFCAACWKQGLPWCLAAERHRQKSHQGTVSTETIGGLAYAAQLAEPA